MTTSSLLSPNQNGFSPGLLKRPKRKYSISSDSNSDITLSRDDSDDLDDENTEELDMDKYNNKEEKEDAKDDQEDAKEDSKEVHMQLDMLPIYIRSANGEDIEFELIDTNCDDDVSRKPTNRKLYAKVTQYAKVVPLPDVRFQNIDESESITNENKRPGPSRATLPPMPSLTKKPVSGNDGFMKPSQLNDKFKTMCIDKEPTSLNSKTKNKKFTGKDKDCMLEFRENNARNLKLSKITTPIHKGDVDMVTKYIPTHGKTKRVRWNEQDPKVGKGSSFTRGVTVPKSGDSVKTPIKTVSNVKSTTGDKNYTENTKINLPDPNQITKSGYKIPKKSNMNSVTKSPPKTPKNTAVATTKDKTPTRNMQASKSSDIINTAGGNKSITESVSVEKINAALTTRKNKTRIRDEQAINSSDIINSTGSNKPITKPVSVQKVNAAVTTRKNKTPIRNEQTIKSSDIINTAAGINAITKAVLLEKINPEVTITKYKTSTRNVQATKSSDIINTDGGNKPKTKSVSLDKINAEVTITKCKTPTNNVQASKLSDVINTTGGIKPRTKSVSLEKINTAVTATKDKMPTSNVQAIKSSNFATYSNKSRNKSISLEKSPELPIPKPCFKTNQYHDVRDPTNTKKRSLKTIQRKSKIKIRKTFADYPEE